MGPKKTRMRKMLESIHRELEGGGEKMKRKHIFTPPNLSSIEKVSFLEEDDSSYGNPLHSTALEEDINSALGHTSKPVKVGRRNVARIIAGASKKGKGTPKKRKTAAVKSRYLQQVEERLVNVSTDTTTSSGQMRSEEQSQNTSDHGSVPSGSASEVAPAGRKRAKSAEPKETTPSARKKTPTVSEHFPSDVPQRPGPVGGTRDRATSLSSEEISDEDPLWVKPIGGMKTFSGRKRNSSRAKPTEVRRAVAKDKKRKSASGLADPVKLPKKASPQTVKNPIDLDIVLAAFQDFVSEYLESLETDSVKRSINSFSRSVEAQLVEAISKTKELNSLKRQNSKVSGAIQQKRVRLMEVRKELRKKEVELRKMEKENSQLEQRLTDIRNSATFLKDLRELQENYLEYREEHPDEREVYGPSSLPGLLLEVRGVLEAEHQLSVINQKLQQVLDRHNSQRPKGAQASCTANMDKTTR